MRVDIILKTHGANSGQWILSFQAVPALNIAWVCKWGNSRGKNRSSVIQRGMGAQRSLGFWWCICLGNLGYGCVAHLMLLDPIVSHLEQGSLLSACPLWILATLLCSLLGHIPMAPCHYPFTTASAPALSTSTVSALPHGTSGSLCLVGVHSGVLAWVLSLPDHTHKHTLLRPLYMVVWNSISTNFQIGSEHKKSFEFLWLSINLPIPDPLGLQSGGTPGQDSVTYLILPFGLFSFSYYTGWEGPWALWPLVHFIFFSVSS